MARLSANLHIACIGSRILARRASCLSGGANTPAKNYTGRLFALLWLDPHTAGDQTTSFQRRVVLHGKRRRDTSVLPFSRPRIYIPSRQREITRKLYDVSNVRSFLSGSAAIASRTSFAKLAAKTCGTRVRCPLAVVIYLRFVCPPAGKEFAFKYREESERMGEKEDTRERYTRTN